MAITDMAVFEWDKQTREMTLVEIAPGLGTEDVQNATGCEYKISPTLKEFQI